MIKCTIFHTNILGAKPAMTIYFGFVPTDELQTQIDDTLDLIANRSDEEFYPYQEKITKRIAHELLDALFVRLIEIIPDSKRQEKMRKLVTTIHSAVETMLKHILSKQDNEKVLDAFHFLHNDCIFTDDHEERRVGFALSTDNGQTLISNFEKAKQTDDSHQLLQEAMDIIIQANLEHFVVEFSKHLHLGAIKRKAIPVAEMAINKASQVAVHKLLPGMDNDACMRLIGHFESFIVNVER